MVRIHLNGNWAAGAVRCEWAASTFDPPAQVRELIERAWAQAAGRLGDRLFDGPMCRLEGYSVSGGRLELRFSRTSYKAFVGTNLSNRELASRFGAGSLANPMGLSCALVSSDGALMLGYRNDRVAYYPGRIHPFAGAMEPCEPLDVFAEVRRELAEELAFGPDDVAEMRCVGMVEDVALAQPELVFLVRSTRERKRIEAQLDEAEHCAVFVVEAEEKAIAAALADERLTPVGVGTVGLWAAWCGFAGEGGTRPA